ncbi:MAG: hypothetical protein LPJ89_00215 [Hymenobacteraceae bacterium]|nr:hypothetical protein [Hymenobacteraceae bacterium]
MHTIEPYYNWLNYYSAADDPRSPLYGSEYSEFEYSNQIYGYYIHPQWDYMESSTLFLKILFADYDNGFAIIEFIGEWNDTLHNDIMILKRNIVEPLEQEGINKFILIGENVFNFHGSDDLYYEEWFEDVEEGWIAAIGFQDFVVSEMKQYNIDNYINFGGKLDDINWRTMPPQKLYVLVDKLIQRRLGA